MYKQNKFSESKVHFRQASNPCKWVLEAVKLVYANKTEFITSQKFSSHDFQQIALVFSTKVNLLYLIY